MDLLVTHERQTRSTMLPAALLAPEEGCGADLGQMEQHADPTWLRGVAPATGTVRVPDSLDRGGCELHPRAADGYRSLDALRSHRVSVMSGQRKVLSGWRETLSPGRQPCVHGKTTLAGATSLVRPGSGTRCCPNSRPEPTSSETHALQTFASIPVCQRSGAMTITCPNLRGVEGMEHNMLWINPVESLILFTSASFLRNPLRLPHEDGLFFSWFATLISLCNKRSCSRSVGLSIRESVHPFSSFSGTYGGQREQGDGFCSWQQKQETACKSC